jgi:hypothetical protein
MPENPGKNLNFSTRVIRKISCPGGAETLPLRVPSLPIFNELNGNRDKGK